VAECVVLPQALTELSIGDNAITALPEDLSGWTSLRKAHFYGNQLQALPLGPRGLLALLLPGTSSSNGSSSTSGPSLASLWLEGNPLSPGCIAQLLQLYGDAYSSGGSSGKKQQPRIGLDDQQLAAGSEVLAQWQQLQEQGLTNVRRGIVKASAGVLGSCRLHVCMPACHVACLLAMWSAGDTSCHGLCVCGFLPCAG
jgi:hypothetical protein